MIVNDIYAKIGDAKSTDEIVVANKEEYYNGAPHDEYGNSKLFKEVVDVVNDNGKLVILVK